MNPTAPAHQPTAATQRLGCAGTTFARSHLPTFALFFLLATPASSAEDANRFVGSWAFSLPDGNPAWLSIRNEAGRAKGSLLWSVGSARPVEAMTISENEITFTRSLRWQPFGNRENARVINSPFRGRIVDSTLQLTVTQSSASGEDQEQLVLQGKRLPPMPPRPDLSQISFGPPLRLLNGRDLAGWRLSNPKKRNGWRVADGVLVNETPKTDFGAYGDYGNLVTEQTFSDFRLRVEYNVPDRGNSGIYLRGMYEAQVVDRDSSMQGINGPGAIFGRIAPTKNAGKTSGEWNQYALTLVDRHITVVLNGETVIDNQPIIGCTGGGLSADDTQPGPIFLQGDHTSVRYRNIVMEERVGR
jgi:hypothetical protein